MKNKKKKGFTLVELMAVIAILGIFSTLIFSLFSSSTSMFVMAENDNVIQNESRMIIDVLEEDIRYSSNFKIEESSNSNNFIDANGILKKSDKLTLQRGEDRYIYEVIGTQFKRTVRKKNGDSVDISEVIPSKNIKEFEIKKDIDGLYRVRIKFKNGKSEYEYKNSIYPMNGN